MDYTKIISALSRVKEALATKIDAVNTSVSGLPDTLDTQFTAVKNDIATVKTDVGSVKTDVGVVDNKVTTLDATLTSMDAKIDKVGVDAEKIANAGNFDFIDETTTSIGNDFSETKILITGAKLPNCESIGDRAFSGISSLCYIDAKNVKHIGGYAFSKTWIDAVDFPLCETVGNYAFDNCGGLKRINLPLVKHIPSSLFSFSCSGDCEDRDIEYINLNSVETVADRGLSNLNGIKELTLPNCVEVGYDAFRVIGKRLEGSNSNGSLDKLTLPKVTVAKGDYYGGGSFRDLYCKVFDFGELNSIETGAFGLYVPATTLKNCCESLILRANSVCTLSSDGFARQNSTQPETPPKNIYVPDDLVASYKKASNWSKYADRIKPLSTYKE
jgi:hypothetical protein